MIIRTRGYILDKHFIEGVSIGDTWVPNRYSFLIAISDPYTQAFREVSIPCSRRVYEQYAVRAWIQVRFNTARWLFFRRWVIDEPRSMRTLQEPIKRG
jgi:hypothetical protein